MSIFDKYRERYEKRLQEEYSLQEYLDLCKEDPLVYATASERMLAAIGEPELIDTSQEPRLSRIFSNKMISRYPAFEEFYGMEDAIEL
ncbi:MAG: PrkA family serine protein kinase, partial [Gammaproteobacteria bacterium]|nr:PrkA family serine protein kinase [Gammaproteobacteria bacterium]